MKTCIVLLSLSLLIPLGGCTQALKTPDQVSAQHQSLTGSWSLQQANKLGTLPTESVTLILRNAVTGDNSKLNVSGHAGVNHFVGKAIVDLPQQRIQIRQIASTRQAGPEPLTQFEKDYLNQLEAVVTYKLMGDRLELNTLHGDTLDFSRQPK